MSENQKKAKPIFGVVTSDKMAQSRVAVVERLIKHPEYKKYIRRTTRVMFHDQNNESKTGDKVLMEPSRPYSARKRFKLLKIVEKAEGLESRES